MAATPRAVIRWPGYLQHVGATAIRVPPVFTDGAVHGTCGHQPAGYHGYHGYRITDITPVDPHLGIDADPRAGEAAHARGMEVAIGVLVDRTVDVIRCGGCPDAERCVRRSRADHAYQHRGGVGRGGDAGFAGGDGASAAEWVRPNDPRLGRHTPCARGPGRTRSGRTGPTTRSAATIAAPRPSRARLRCSAIPAGRTTPPSDTRALSGA